VQVGGPAVDDLEQHVGEIELHAYPSLGFEKFGDVSADGPGSFTAGPRPGRASSA
jgi:hypothetical protein